jgi:hypothetical protein
MKPNSPKKKDLAAKSGAGCHNMKPSMPTLRQRFEEHPGGHYCLLRMPNLEGAAIWRYPITDCLLLHPFVSTAGPNPLCVRDLLTDRLVFCWEGAPNHAAACDERGVWGVRHAIEYQGLDPETGEELWDDAIFSSKWLEAVLSFDCNLSAQHGHFLSRRPWSWDDREAILAILTHLSQQNVNHRVPLFPWFASDSAGLEPMLIHDWEAWDLWCKAQQDDAVRNKLLEVKARCVGDGRYPVDLTAKKL